MIIGLNADGHVNSSAPGERMFYRVKDDGYTGTNTNRPQFQALMKEPRTGAINVMVTTGSVDEASGCSKERLFFEKRTKSRPNLVVLATLNDNTPDQAFHCPPLIIMYSASVQPNTRPSRTSCPNGTLSGLVLYLHRVRSLTSGAWAMSGSCSCKRTLPTR